MKKIVFLSSLFMFKIMSFAQSNFTDDYAYDEEREQTRSRMEGFHFTTTETWMIPIGLVLFYFGFNLYKKRQSEKQEGGLLSIVLMVLGFMCVAPLIIGILGLINKIIATIIIGIIIFAIIRFIRSMFN